MRFVAVALTFLLLLLAAAWAVDDAGLTPAAVAPYLAPYQDAARAWAPKVIAGLALLTFLALLLYRPKPAAPPPPSPSRPRFPPCPRPSRPTRRWSAFSRCCRRRAGWSIS